MSDNLAYRVKKREGLKTPLFLKPKKLLLQKHLSDIFDIFRFLDT
jgi:hypothetical protein